MDERIVAVFGTGRAKAGDSAYELAYEVGRELAAAGFTIVNGGYGGTMLAASKGASEAGGKVIGVTCSAFGGKANECVSREIVTESLDERLDMLIRLGEAYIVLPGGTGTLLELAKVWELKNKGFLDGGKAIILVGEFWKPLVGIVASDDAASSRSVEQVDGAGDAVALIPD
ncbi:MAG: LOG family protein [Planctomycetota bacterium]|jgi:uncharacterized protein (TIGR00730 family)